MKFKDKLLCLITMLRYPKLLFATIHLLDLSHYNYEGVYQIEPLGLFDAFAIIIHTLENNNRLDGEGEKA